MCAVSSLITIDNAYQVHRRQPYQIRTYNIRFYTSCFEIQQDRQCTYNVTPRRVRATIVVEDKQ